jgi:hypothetical protein
MTEKKAELTTEDLPKYWQSEDFFIFGNSIVLDIGRANFVVIFIISFLNHHKYRADRMQIPELRQSVYVVRHTKHRYNESEIK